MIKTQNTVDLGRFLKERNLQFDYNLNAWTDDGTPQLMLEDASVPDIGYYGAYDLSVVKWIGRQPIKITVYNVQLEALAANYDRYVTALCKAWSVM